MTRYLKYIFIIVVIYNVIAIYGSTREFQDTLNAATEVTPEMLQMLFKCIKAYIIFIGVLIMIGQWNYHD